MPKRKIKIERSCLHCEVNEILRDDICDNETSSPSYHGACMGRAVGQIIGLADDELERAGFKPSESHALSSDERYRAAVQCLAFFGDELCKASKLLDITSEHLLSDAARMAKQLATKTKRR